MRLSIFGLGKLGLCTAACFASRGHRVVGFDADPRHLAGLAARQNPIRETGLDELLEKAWPNLTVTDDLAAMVLESEVSLIIVPTPSLPDGRFSNQAVKAVLGAIGPVLKDKPGFHVVDVVSTVMPGSSDHIFRPLLEKLSGKTCGRDFGLVYNPEFIALGSVLDNFLNPDLVLIGASDQESGHLIRDLYLSTSHNRPHMALMSLLNAEITKLSLNAYITTKISFANELAALCELVPGADVDVVTKALGMDTRIGGKCLKSGLGFGGPCFPRDNQALQAFARETGRAARLAPRVVEINDEVVDRLFGLIHRHVPPPGRIALLGLAYKPHTPVVEESQSLMLAARLAQAGYTVLVHDPEALEGAREVLGEEVAYCHDPQDCAQDAQAMVLLTPWPHYARLNWGELAGTADPAALLVDCWGMLKDREVPNFRYLCLGVGDVGHLHQEAAYERAANL